MAAGFGLASPGAREVLRRRFARTPLRRRRGLCLPLGLLLGGVAVADTASLAQVGPLAIDVARYRQRAALVSALEWPELGATWPEQRRRFLDVLTAELLLTLAAEREPAALPTARDRALARTLTAGLDADAARATPDEAEVRAYHTRHQSEFVTPRALSLWRILLGSEAEARAVIAELRTPTPAAFSRLARERSTDHATHMRAGNLGQVRADGQTQMPELRVAPALFEAADRVRDGELVPEPVREGEAFAVVWRRASHPARVESIAEASAVISARLSEEHAAAAHRALLQALRREHLGEYHPERVAAVSPRFPERGGPPRRFGAAPVGNEPPRLVPQPTDRGLR
jgi:peptidyl-prolyl cis-trans isomerase C